MDYTRSIQRTVAYIEAHLGDALTLDRLSAEAGFSKYHFLRVFKRETGTGLWDHIQGRRLSEAARLLRTTEIPILDVALRFRFESQEAFTRAFKKKYSLPPGKYRRAMNRLIPEQEDDSMEHQRRISGWIVTGSTPEQYEASLDCATSFQGTKSVLLKSVAGEPAPGGAFGTVMQQFRAKNYIGKRVRFSGFVRAEKVLGWGGLWMRIDSSTANTVKIDNMQNRPIRGDADWNRYSVVLDVPENSAIISIGLLLYGEGAVWLDGARFETVDARVPATDTDIASGLPEEPRNLDFEGDPEGK